MWGWCTEAALGVNHTFARLRCALTHSGLVPTAAIAATSLRLGATEYCRPIPHLRALVNIDASAINKTQITKVNAARER